MIPGFPLGTDGWRGVLAEGCTFDSVERVAAAAAAVYRSFPAGDASRVVIGHDTRFLSPELARAAAEVFARAGIGVLLADRAIPTPAVSWHVRRLGLAGGLAITASHNPAEYNGVKIKTHLGSSAPPELYEMVARAIDGPRPGAGKPGAIEVLDLAAPYRERLSTLVDLDAIRRSGMTILADSMHGAAGTLLAEIVSGNGKGKGEGTRVFPFRHGRDPLFGGVNPEPIASNLSAAAEAMSAVHGDLALAQDGDADRLGVLDASGGFVSPHRVLALLLLHAFRRRGLSGGIARTFSTSLLIDRVAAGLGAPLHETAIGFKYIAELMNRGEAVAGGEESGGYAFALHLPERDGVFNALLLVESLALAGGSLEESLERLALEFGSFAYGRRDVYLPVALIRDYLEEVRGEPPREVAGERVTEVRDLDGVKYFFGPRGWLLHRLSGTEPMIRLYCEHEDEAVTESVLAEAEGRLREFAVERKDL
ncbi:MAG TPA: phosphoglucomutase/phosphomannomutase family protein [Thermoanaerobaculia bacterium]|nr:phosphoglucomutase/phosphomannomutase family protein [Thermoanaerobaculia bacterium]